MSQCSSPVPPVKPFSADMASRLLVLDSLTEFIRQSRGHRAKHPGPWCFDLETLSRVADCYWALLASCVEDE